MSQLVCEAAWFKSSYSSENGTNCVEVADLRPIAHVGIRDSKRKAGPALVVPAAAWAEFVAGTQSGLWQR
ncbi:MULTISPECIES: DUF397 domain-containing protein [unclassified Streptomyces]|uniref:DUF397 domain-containing protein n=1 Tax=unclassified Streptomyces TaxID=2593676 RepID=UPI002E771838|nr:DUF397 domain-containing protein [Streptomyces sp. JV176]